MTRLASLVVVSALILAAPALHARVQEPPLFVPGPGVPVGPGSGPVVLADVNRDGHVDLISKHLLRRLVQVRLGNGRGEFPAAGNSSLRLRYQPGAIRLGDLDEDGRPAAAEPRGTDSPARKASTPSRHVLGCRRVFLRVGRPATTANRIRIVGVTRTYVPSCSQRFPSRPLKRIRLTPGRALTRMRPARRQNGEICITGSVSLPRR